MYLQPGKPGRLLPETSLPGPGQELGDGLGPGLPGPLPALPPQGLPEGLHRGGGGRPARPRRRLSGTADPQCGAAAGGLQGGDQGGPGPLQQLHHRHVGAAEGLSHAEGL